MKIEKKLIKELVDNLKEFELSELEYQDGQTKVKVSKVPKLIDQVKTSAVVSPNKSVIDTISVFRTFSIGLGLAFIQMCLHF